MKNVHWKTLIAGVVIGFLLTTLDVKRLIQNGTLPGMSN